MSALMQRVRPQSPSNAAMAIMTLNEVLELKAVCELRMF